VKSLQTTDDGRQVMAIVHLDLWSRWTNNIKISSIYCYFNLEMVREVFIYLKFWQCKNNMADDSCDVTKIIYFFNVYK
jgi:hypothetical protein